MTDFTATTSPAIFETNGSTNTWRVSNVGIQGEVGDLPTQTGNGGAVLGTNGTAASWARSFTSPDGETVVSAYDGGAGLDWDGAGGAYAYADVDGSIGAYLDASNGTATASVYANLDGTLDLTATGAVTVTPGDGFHVVGDVGETVLSGDDYLMSTASDTDVQAPGATFARARGSVGSESAVTNGDILAYPLYAQGHDGTGLVLAGQITAEVDGTVATGKVPTRIRIATADADGVLTDRMTIGADGTTDVLGDFTVNGSPVSGGGGGGGLVLIDSGTFTGASSVAINSVFSSTYDDYEVVLDVESFSGSDAELRARLRVSGADATSSVYDQTIHLYDGGHVNIGTMSGSYWLANLLYSSYGADGATHRFRLSNPAVAKSTRMVGESQHQFSTMRVNKHGAIHRASTVYDGMDFYLSTGSMDGHWAVYGYAK